MSAFALKNTWNALLTSATLLAYREEIARHLKNTAEATKNGISNLHTISRKVRGRALDTNKAVAAVQAELFVDLPDQHTFTRSEVEYFMHRAVARVISGYVLFLRKKR